VGERVFHGATDVASPELDWLARPGQCSPRHGFSRPRKRTDCRRPPALSRLRPHARSRAPPATHRSILRCGCGCVHRSAALAGEIVQRDGGLRGELLGRDAEMFDAYGRSDRADDPVVRGFTAHIARLCGLTQGRRPPTSASARTVDPPGAQAGWDALASTLRRGRGTRAHGVRRTRGRRRPSRPLAGGYDVLTWRTCSSTAATRVPS
jgi:hypothetical protein